MFSFSKILGSFGGPNRNERNNDKKQPNFNPIEEKTEEIYEKTKKSTPTKDPKEFEKLKDQILCEISQWGKDWHEIEITKHSESFHHEKKVSHQLNKLNKSSKNEYIKKFLDYPQEIQSDPEILETFIWNVIKQSFYLYGKERIKEIAETEERFFKQLSPIIKSDLKCAKIILLNCTIKNQAFKLLDPKIQKILINDKKFMIDLYSGCWREDIKVIYPKEWDKDIEFICELASRNFEFFKKKMIPIILINNPAENLKKFILTKKPIWPTPWKIIECFDDSIKSNLFKDEDFIISLIDYTKNNKRIWIKEDELRLINSHGNLKPKLVERASFIDPYFLRFLGSSSQEDAKFVLKFYEECQDRLLFAHRYQHFDLSLLYDNNFLLEGIKIDPMFTLITQISDYLQHERNQTLAENLAKTNAAIYIYMYKHIENGKFFKIVETLDDKQIDQIDKELDKLYQRFKNDWHDKNKTWFFDCPISNLKEMKAKISDLKAKRAFKSYLNVFFNFK